jgi:hypothetical protein
VGAPEGRTLLAKPVASPAPARKGVRMTRHFGRAEPLLFCYVRTGFANITDIINIIDLATIGTAAPGAARI